MAGKNVGCVLMVEIDEYEKNCLEFSRTLW
jgi:hypothetical protein